MLSRDAFELITIRTTDGKLLQVERWVIEGMPANINKQRTFTTRQRKVVRQPAESAEESADISTNSVNTHTNNQPGETDNEVQDTNPGGD